MIEGSAIKHTPLIPTDVIRYVEGPTAYKLETVTVPVEKEIHINHVVYRVPNLFKILAALGMVLALILGHYAHAQSGGGNGINGGVANAANNALNSGSLILPSQAGRVPVQSMSIPHSGWTAYHADGDSITFGDDATSTANNYVNILDSAIGSPTLTNNAIAGSQIGDVNNRLFNNENPGAASTVLETVMVGINDAVNGDGPGTYEPIFNNLALANMTWLTIPSTYKTSATSVLPQTNWSTDTTYAGMAGAQSTSFNATLNIGYTTTVVGQQVVLWYRIINGTGGTFSVADTGGANSVVATNFTIPGIEAQSYTQGVGVIILYNKTRAIGTYNLAVTEQSIDSSTVSILGIGVVPPTPSAGNPMWEGGITRIVNDQEQSYTSTYDQDIQSDVAYLDSIGLEVNYVNVNNYFKAIPGIDMSPNQGSSSTNCITDSSGWWIHPCNTGHAELAAAFLGKTAVPNFNVPPKYYSLFTLPYAQKTIYQNPPYTFNQLLNLQGVPGTVTYYNDLIDPAGLGFTDINGSSLTQLTGCAPANALDNNHPGELAITTGATSGKGVSCTSNSLGTALQTPWHPFYFESVVLFPVLPGSVNSAYQVGLGAGLTANPWVDNETFYLSSANTNANDFYCDYNSGSNLTDSGVTASANIWYRLTITDDGQFLRFFINGTQVCGNAILAANTSPSPFYVGGSATALSTTSEYMLMDYIIFQQTGLNR
jgi:hypothetical protein